MIMIRYGEISDLPETKHLIILRIPTVLSISKDCYIEDIPQTKTSKKSNSYLQTLNITVKVSTF